MLFGLLWLLSWVWRANMQCCTFLLSSHFLSFCLLNVVVTHLVKATKGMRKSRIIQLQITKSTGPSMLTLPLQAQWHRQKSSKVDSMPSSFFCPPLFPTLLRQHLEGVSHPGFNQAHLHFSLFPLHICGGMTLLHFLSLLFQPGCVTGAVTWV